MAILNDIYFNAAFTGFYAGAFAGRALGSVAAADFVGVKDAAVAMATKVDSLIAFDALVTTAMAATQLAITTNTIAADEQWRAGLLQQLCRSCVEGRTPISTVAGSTAWVASTQAAALVAQWTEGLLGLVTP